LTIDPGTVAGTIRALRKARPKWDPRKLLARLAMDHPARCRPAASTVGDRLRQEGVSLPCTRVAREPGTKRPQVEPCAQIESLSAAAPVTFASLFFAFLQVSLFGAGGGIVWAYRIAVEQRRWLAEEEFTDILSLCQFMPGPNVVGIAVCVGARLRGAAGAIAAVAGFVLVPGITGFCLGIFLLQYAHIVVLQHILGGVSAAASGLLIAAGIRMLKPHRNRWWAWVTAALAFAGVAFTKLPLLPVLFGVALLGIAGTMIARPRPQ